MLIFLILLVAPIVASAANYLLGDRRENWQAADRSSAGLLPNPADHSEALIRVFAARTVRWRGIFAVHTWIVVKERGSARYSRYDYTAWGEPIRVRTDAIRAVPTSAYPQPAPRPKNSRLDTTRLRRAFGFTLPPWQSGVDRMLDEILVGPGSEPA